MLERRGLHLFPEQFLIDQPVENRTAVIVGELVQRTAIEQRFVTQGFVPVTLQNDVPIDGSHNAVDHFSGASRRQKHRTHQQA